MPESYKRYLVNGLRDHFDMPGTPIRLTLRGQGDKNPFKDTLQFHTRHACESTWRKDPTLIMKRPANWRAFFGRRAVYSAAMVITGSISSRIFIWSNGI